MTSSASSESGVTSRKLIAAALAGALVSAAATSVVVQWSGRRHGRRGKGKQKRQDDVGSDVEDAKHQLQDRRTSVVRGVPGLIGSTPLMRIESLSEMTGCEILVSSIEVLMH